MNDVRESERLRKSLGREGPIVVNNKKWSCMGLVLRNWNMKEDDEFVMW